MTKRTSLVLVTVAAVVAVTGAAAAVAGKKDGFKTEQPSMFAAVKAGVEIEPLLTVGDVLPGGYRFEAIPDGIALDPKGKDVDVWVSHETSMVPFPYNTAGPLPSNGENDFENSQLSHLVLDDKTAEVKSGELAITSSAGFQRFCSIFLATKEQGFDKDVLFANEESPDYVFRQAASWPPPLDNTGAEEVGLVVAFDVKKGTYQPIYGMGRHNHENSVAIPGFKENVVLSGDDTFSTGSLTDPDNPGGPKLAPSQSQLYSYIAKDTKKLLKDEGDLWAFVSDTPGVTSYYDVAPGAATEITGHFIKVPKDIATGRKPDGSTMTSADKGYPAPPTDGSWQRDLRSVAPVGVDGPQWVLEYWSDTHNVFQFVRIEDIAYDKQKGKEGKDNVVYIVDSGRGSTGPAAAGKSTNGRVWKMVFDKKDPTVVTSLTVFVEGDDNPVKTYNEVHQPDNVETTKHGLLLTEDPGSSQQFNAAQQVSDPAATQARLWFVPFEGDPEVVLKVDQSADGGATDVDGRSAGNWGAWETTGIVDASKAFGKDMFLLNVQAHTLWVEKADGPGFTYKREGGQLALIKIPGAN